MTIATHYTRYEAAKRALSIANGLGQPFRSRAMGLLNKHRAALKRAQTGRKPLKKYDVHAEGRIQGIPCGVHVTRLISGSDGNICCAPEHAEPPTESEVEFIITDLSGYEAPWLEKKMTRRDEEGLKEVAFDYIRERSHA